MKKKVDHFKFKVGDIIRHVLTGKLYRVVRHHVPTNGLPDFWYYTRPWPTKKSEALGADFRWWVEEHCEYVSNTKVRFRIKKELGL